MRISKQSKREGRRLFYSCVANGVLDENRARQVIRFVVEQKPRGYVGILSQFERLVKLDVDRHNAKIESATPLTPEIQAQMQANLTRIYGSGLNFSFTQNPDLLGGMRIQVGGDVYNGSVRARLTALQESF